MNMKCIIVDDDEIARMDIEQHVKGVDSLKLLKTCSTALEASNMVLNEKVDLIFLDILMPEMTGLQLLESFNHSKPQVIFVSSNKDYAQAAFDVDVTDFLIKPFSGERFLRAVAKAKYWFEISNHGISIYDDAIFIKVNSRLVKLNMTDIFLVEGLADYVSIYTSANKYVIHSTMKAVENKLPNNDFFRVHNSYIIRLDKISEIEDNTLVVNKKLIPVSRAHKKGLLDRLKLI